MSSFDETRIHATDRLRSAMLPPRAPHEVPAHEPLAEIPSRVADGLLFLLQAKEYGADVGTDLWTFALELRELRSLGLMNSDLRWLALKGYVEFARETTLPGDPERNFQPLQGLMFTKRTCCVITAAGVEAVQRHDLRTADGFRRIPAVPRPSSPPPRVLPHWDPDLQELRVNGLIVKQFKVPAPNQEMVLAAFEEERWPARIDDPLPPQADQEPKRRLHDTIVSLNRSHKHRLIRFTGDGSGEGVRWTLVSNESSDDGASTQ